VAAVLFVRDRDDLDLVPATFYALACVVGALHAPWLTAAALVLALAVGVLAHLRAGALVALAGGAGAVTALAALGWTVGALMDAPRSPVALVVVVILGAVVLATPWLPAGHGTDGIEVGAAASALPVVLAGVLAAPSGETATWTAVYLTAAGALVTAVSLQRQDRRQLAWVGGLLLAAASWVRLADVGVHAPEAYTLPSAVALLAVGIWRMRAEPESDTMRTLSAGLGLAVVPSLLWVLADPTSWRALLLGLGCLTLVLAGVALRWSAPVLFGAVAGGLLVVRFAAPYVEEAVPRWALLGTAGALLLVVGATWEARRGDARSVANYMRALR